MGKGGETASVDFLTSKKNESIQSTGEVKEQKEQKEQTQINATKPWYRRGGMHVNEVGMGINVAVTPLLLVASAPGALFDSSSEAQPFFLGASFPKIFGAVLFFNIVTAFFVHKMRTVFCVVAVPIYMASLLNILTLESAAGPIFGLCMVIAIWRVGICMSVCLHRYSAHAAFKCGPGMQLFLNVLGCMAHQGGPIWWGSQHRCHHKYCDLPRDPHSAIQVGTERAFSFFQEISSVDEEFAPIHNDNWYLRIIDTWSFAVATLEMFVATMCFGRDGLFVSYTSMWLCQTVTLWFNVANHPESAPGKVCKAADYRVKPQELYPAFQLLHILYPVFGKVVGETSHDDHHKHFMLAKRDAYDLPYYFFIFPLEKMGLIWDVKNTRWE